jgi:DNA invertase Pin-like site-specific DNA recombinase
LAFFLRKVYRTICLMIYGYARVPTDGQSEAALRQLRAVGAKKVFREVASGAKTDRPQLRRLVAEIGSGDVVMVTRLDRLARSTRDLLNTLAAITGKNAEFRSLADAWTDLWRGISGDFGSSGPCHRKISLLTLASIEPT